MRTGGKRSETSTDDVGKEEGLLESEQREQERGKVLTTRTQWRPLCMRCKTGRIRDGVREKRGKGTYLRVFLSTKSSEVDGVRRGP